MPQQYVVPQFLTVEPKIIGSVTMRQFIWCLGTVTSIFITYKLLVLTFFIPIAIIEVIIGATFAFVKINALPFQYFLINYLQTVKRPSVRVWGKEYSDKELKQFMNEKAIETEIAEKFHRRPSEARLAQLSLVVNTGGAFSPDDENVLRPLSSIKDLDDKIIEEIPE